MLYQRRIAVWRIRDNNWYTLTYRVFVRGSPVNNNANHLVCPTVTANGVAVW